MSFDIDDFVKKVTPNSERDLARVNIVGGDRKPFYSAQMRSFFREGGSGTGLVTSESFGLRSLLVDASTRALDSTSVHAPTLLRVYPRPRKSWLSNHRQIFLWSTKGVVKGKLQVADGASDLLAAPFEPWPEPPLHDVRLPPLRLVDGRADGDIELDGQLRDLLLYDKSDQSLFGGLRIRVTNSFLNAALVPQGIEFQGSLPDPTRDFDGAVGDRIEGTFRLECDTSGKEPAYLLRLVGVTSESSRAAINKTEDHIAAAMSGLAGSPVAIRYDKRPVVPPLFWPLEQKDGALKLVPSGQDFEMRIEVAAVDVRLKTQGMSSEERGLATILAGSITWKRAAESTVELAILGGSKIGTADPKPSGDVMVNFRKADDVWTTNLDSMKKPFTIPLGPIAERLLPIYKAGGGLPQDASHAPYVFLPVREGWLQIALPKPPPDDKKSNGQASVAGPTSAMSGRIFFAAQDKSNRSVVLDAAAGIDLRIKWKADTTERPVLDEVMLAADGSQGQVLGVLYASESSPNAREALPTLKGGPASTRDLPLWFGTKAAKPHLEGEFEWNPKANQFSGRVTRLPITPTDQNAAAICWLPPTKSAYISNFPLTRSLPSAPEPSVSRGLIPMRLDAPAPGKPIFTLTSEEKTGLLPVLQVEKKGWFGFLSYPDDKSDRLILPTLAGTEFRPEKNSLAIDCTVLRFDLPILDELFAWSDPPKKKANEQSEQVKQAPPMPTALQPDELASSWDASRDRMALTRTQAAQVTEWIAFKPTAPQRIGNLVEPYVWSANVNVQPDAQRGWGQYELEATGFGATYAKNSAAEGLGGDKPVGFAITASAINRDDKGPIQIAGFAANLYRYKVNGSTLERLWDSRGYGLSPKVEKGIRQAGYLDKGDGAEQAYELLTSSGTESIHVNDQSQPWSFATDLCFFVRDLPLQDGSFDGTKENTPEGALGTTGKAFEREDFPTSLYEWRLFEALSKGEDRESSGQQKKDVRPAPYDIHWGPFVFKPLRLREASFDADGKPTTIVVLGSMRFNRDTASDERRISKGDPFGPDEVYQRSDLFTLTLTLASGKWRYAWDGKKALPSNVVELDTRAPEVSFPISLKAAINGLFKSVDPVRSIVSVNINTKTASFEIRLFGRDYLVKGATVTPNAIGFTVQLPVGAFTPPATHPTGVFAKISKAEVDVKGSSGTLLLDGTLNVHAVVDGKPSKTAIVTLGEADFDWLGIAVTKMLHEVEVDHATGQFSWRLKEVRTNLKAAPFGFKAAGLGISAAIVAVASQTSTEAPATIASFGMSSVWMQVCATDTGEAGGRMVHTLLGSRDGLREHSLGISWSKVVNSPIDWPELSQLMNEDGTAIPDDWLQPAKAKTAERSRKISIAGDAGARLQHQITFQLKAHRFDGDSLAVAGGIASVSRPVRLLALANHRLGRDNAWSEWTALDHLVVTTPIQIAGMDKEDTFAPLQNGASYRGDKLTVINGIAVFPRVLSGFFDTFLIQEWWTKAGNSEAPVMLGGAAVQFPDGNVAAYTAVVPWLDAELAGLPKNKRLNRSHGFWRVPSVDLWPATPLVARPMPTVVLDRQADSASIDRQFGAGRFSPLGFAGDPGAREIIPVEQAYFEKWIDGKAKPLESTDLEAAPFFLRAMMAIAARRNRDDFSKKKTIDWKASTIQAGRFLSSGKPAVAAVRVTVRENDVPSAEEAQVLVFADLVVLSRNCATRLERYRRIEAVTADDLAGREVRDEIAETASDLDADVMIAVRVSEKSDGHTAVALRTIARPLEELRPGKTLTPVDRDIGASAALGWPTDVGTENLAKLGPALGDELPLLGHESGFAGRFQMFGWPAFAPGMTSADPAALYVSFANHIVYDRGTAIRLGFDGPAARHLVPVPTRRRAPLSSVTEAALEAVLRQTPASEYVTPILPPIIERGTIGRRPGVMEAAITSMTIPADEKGFDPKHERFGRPANSGPVAAHQLRNPRSPVLPADLLLDAGGQLMDIVDSEHITFGLRRRTYVSLADLDTTTGRLSQFLHRPGLVDAARFELKGSRHDRALFSLVTSAAIDPNWQGQAKIHVEVASRADKDAALEVTVEGRIEVGQVSSLLTIKGENDPQFVSSLTFPLVNPSLEVRVEGLGAIQAALLEATADTPIRLVLELKDGKARDQQGELPQGPRRQILLPMMLGSGTRRVLPVRPNTIIFGDPAYDRQLASQTASAAPGGGDSFLLAADRRAYDLGSTLYFAAGNIDTKSGEFSESETTDFKVSFARLPPQTLIGDQPPPQPLRVRGAESKDGTYDVKHDTVIEIGLGQFVATDTPPDATTTCPLLPGDRLQIVAILPKGTDNKQRTATLQVDIVAEPVIAPPPSVYSVVETANDTARVRLHAAAPLPQKIEFPNLLKDLALGHVRRRALFVWHYVLPGAAEETENVKVAIELLKFDRSGGAQFDDSVERDPARSYDSVAK